MRPMTAVGTFPTFANASHANRQTGEENGKPADKPGSVPPLRGSAIIPLGLPSPTGSSNLPGSSAGHASASLFGLAPDGVYRAVRRYRGRGELLPRRFTLTCAPCDAIGGLFSVALSVALRRPAVSWHPALRSPDFPPDARASSDCLADFPRGIIARQIDASAPPVVVRLA